MRSPDTRDSSNAVAAAVVAVVMAVAVAVAVATDLRHREPLRPSDQSLQQQPQRMK